MKKTILFASICFILILTGCIKKIQIDNQDTNLPTANVNQNADQAVDPTTDWLDYDDSINQILFKYPLGYRPKSKHDNKQWYTVIYTPTDLSHKDGAGAAPLAAIYKASVYDELGGETFSSLEEANKIFLSERKKCKNPKTCSILSVEKTNINNVESIRITRQGSMIRTTVIIPGLTDDLIVVNNLSGENDIFNFLLSTIKHK